MAVVIAEEIAGYAERTTPTRDCACWISSAKTRSSGTAAMSSVATDRWLATSPLFFAHSNVFCGEMSEPTAVGPRDHRSLGEAGRREATSPGRSSGTLSDLPGPERPLARPEHGRWTPHAVADRLRSPARIEHGRPRRSPGRRSRASCAYAQVTGTRSPVAADRTAASVIARLLTLS